jgi:hypothetical protein
MIYDGTPVKAILLPNHNPSILKLHHYRSAVNVNLRSQKHHAEHRGSGCAAEKTRVSRSDPRTTRVRVVL